MVPSYEQGEMASHTTEAKAAERFLKDLPAPGRRLSFAPSRGPPPLSHLAKSTRGAILAGSGGWKYAAA
jgi:hypothetical protein